MPGYSQGKENACRNLLLNYHLTLNLFKICLNNKICSEMIDKSFGTY